MVTFLCANDNAHGATLCSCRSRCPSLRPHLTAGPSPCVVEEEQVQVLARLWTIVVLHSKACPWSCGKVRGPAKKRVVCTCSLRIVNLPPCCTSPCLCRPTLACVRHAASRAGRPCALAAPQDVPPRHQGNAVHCHFPECLSSRYRSIDLNVRLRCVIVACICAA